MHFEFLSMFYLKKFPPQLWAAVLMILSLMAKIILIMLTEDFQLYRNRIIFNKQQFRFSLHIHLVVNPVHFVKQIK